MYTKTTSSQWRNYDSQYPTAEAVKGTPMFFLVAHTQSHIECFFGGSTPNVFWGHTPECFWGLTPNVFLWGHTPNVFWGAHSPI